MSPDVDILVRSLSNPRQFAAGSPVARPGQVICTWDHDTAAAVAPPSVREHSRVMRRMWPVLALFAAAAPGCRPATATLPIAGPMSAHPAVQASTPPPGVIDLADGERLLSIPSNVWRIRQLSFEVNWTDGDELALPAGLDVVASVDGEPTPELVTWANRERVFLELDCTRPPPVDLQRGHCTVDRVTPQLLGGNAAMLQELGLAIRKVTDADLGELAALGNLVYLDLYGKTRITDRGIAALSKVITLRTLVLQLTGVGDAGLRSLRALPHLVSLDLSETKVTDAGVRGLSALEHLQYLDVSSTSVTGAGVEHLEGLRTLRIRGMRNDADLERIAKLPNLRWLAVSGDENGVTDDGMGHLARLRGLVGLEIIINRPHVSASGVARLGELTTLRELRISGSAVDDGSLQPLASLSRLRKLDLYAAVVGDAGLAHVSRLGELRSLRVASGFSDVGLHHLAALHELRELILDRPNDITDLQSLGTLRQLRTLMIMDVPVPDARWLAHLTALRVLVLRGTKVGDAALRDIGTLAQLRELHLDSTPIGDAGLAALSPLSALRFLALDSTGVTDRGIEHLEGLERLQTLSLRRTQVGDFARAALKRARPGLAVW